MDTFCFPKSLSLQQQCKVGTLLQCVILFDVFLWFASYGRMYTCNMRACVIGVSRYIYVQYDILRIYRTPIPHNYVYTNTISAITSVHINKNYYISLMLKPFKYFTSFKLLLFYSQVKLDVFVLGTNLLSRKTETVVNCFQRCLYTILNISNKHTGLSHWFLTYVTTQHFSSIFGRIFCLSFFI